MSAEPLRLAVNAANPGQFLACCGVLELADRIFGDASGWFEDGQFLIDTRGSLTDVLAVLLAELPEEVTLIDGRVPVKPLIAPLRLHRISGPLVLDAWMTVRVEKGEVVATANPPWNFWSGQQTSMRIWMALREALQAQLLTVQSLASGGLFSELVPLSGRFGFDPGAAWNALDLGFSANAQQVAVGSSPAVELLAAVGLQRFRPSVSSDRSSFAYSTWRRPSSPPIAAALASGHVKDTAAVPYVGRVVSRGSYAALGFSSVR